MAIPEVSFVQLANAIATVMQRLAQARGKSIQRENTSTTISGDTQGLRRRL